MKKTNSLLELVIKEINNFPSHKMKDFSIYLFGSILQINEPNDIDLLITYNSEFISIKAALQFKKDLSKELSNIPHLPLDISILSNNENETSNFSQEEKAQFIR